MAARDRYAIAQAVERLRFAADNLGVNDWPSGQGAARDLLGWTSARTVREAFGPPAGDGRPPGR